MDEDVSEITCRHLLLSRWTDMPRRNYEEGRGVKGVYGDKR
jgi:hypothetical protein